jgi:hypothetical protein
MYRDGTDAWVTGKNLDAAIKCNEIYTTLEKTNAALENWSPSLLTTLKGYRLYCAKHVGSTSTSEETISATLNGLPLHPQRFALTETSSKATPTPPLASLLRAALESPSVGLTSCEAVPEVTIVTKAPPGDTVPMAPPTGAAKHVAVSTPATAEQPVVWSSSNNQANPAAAKPFVITTEAASNSSGVALPNLVQPDPLAATAIGMTLVASDKSASAPPNHVQPHLVAKGAITPTTAAASDSSGGGPSRTWCNQTGCHTHLPTLKEEDFA